MEYPLFSCSLPPPFCSLFFFFFFLKTLILEDTTADRRTKGAAQAWLGGVDPGTGHTTSQIRRLEAATYTVMDLNTRVEYALMSARLFTCLFESCAALRSCTHACAIVAWWGYIWWLLQVFPSPPRVNLLPYICISLLPPFSSLIVSPLLTGATVTRRSCKQATRAVHACAAQQGAHVAMFLVEAFKQ